MNALSWRLVALAGRLTKRLHVIAPQTVLVDDAFLDADRILDLGGGGEGVIGLLRGRQVTAVDIRQGELDDAPEGPVKVVADARRLPFAAGSFDAATAFFFLMYVPADDRPAVVREAFRVLAPGGCLRIWDANIPPRGGRTAGTFVVPLCARLPNRTIRTAYGVPWEGREMSGGDIARLGRDAGFTVTTLTRTDQTFQLVLSKPA